MKKNIDYYPHRTEAHRHPKFRMLRSIYGNGAEGWAAEGRFWALNNLIASAEDCKLDLRKRRNKGVFADELGMSIEEFDEFINVLKSEDVELITEIEPGIYTTEVVSETYSAVLADREKARAKKRKNLKNTSSPENLKSSPELSKSSPEPNNKVNRSEVNGMEWNKSEVNKSETSTFFTKKLFSLFASRTKIRDPNRKLHIDPILEILSHVPEELSADDVWECVEEAIGKLSPSEGVRMDFITQNIRACVARKREQILEKEKQALLRQAQADRRKEALKEAERQRLEAERIRQEKGKKLAEIRGFLAKNKDKIPVKDKLELEKALKNETLILAEAIMFGITEKLPLDAEGVAKNDVNEVGV